MDTRSCLQDVKIISLTVQYIVIILVYWIANIGTTISMELMYLTIVTDVKLIRCILPANTT